jgi:hypothetical protein
MIVHEKIEGREKNKTDDAAMTVASIVILSILPEKYSVKIPPICNLSKALTYPPCHSTVALGMFNYLQCSRARVKKEGQPKARGPSGYIRGQSFVSTLLYAL